MKVDRELLKKIEGNALIKLSEKEKKEILPQLKDVINAFSKISEVNTNKIEPAFLPTDITNNPRKDEIGECLTQKDALKNTKHKEKGYFKSPKPF